MQAHITKWGNSLGVRIPRVLADKIGFYAGTAVDLSIRDHHIIISKGYSLDSMLKDVKAENLHQEISEGPSRGKESW